MTSRCSQLAAIFEDYVTSKRTNVLPLGEFCRIASYDSDWQSNDKMPQGCSSIAREINHFYNLGLSSHSVPEIVFSYEAHNTLTDGRTLFNWPWTEWRNKEITNITKISIFDDCPAYTSSKLGVKYSRLGNFVFSTGSTEYSQNKIIFMIVLLIWHLLHTQIHPIFPDILAYHLPTNYYSLVNRAYSTKIQYYAQLSYIMKTYLINKNTENLLIPIKRILFSLITKLMLA